MENITASLSEKDDKIMDLESTIRNKEYENEVRFSNLKDKNER